MCPKNRTVIQGNSFCDLEVREPRVSRSPECQTFDCLELQTVDFEANRGFWGFSFATGRPQAAGGNAAPSLGVPRPGFAS